MSCEREMLIWSMEMNASKESDPPPPPPKKKKKKKKIRLPIRHICAHAWGTGCTTECGGVVFRFLNFGLIS